MLGFPEFDSLSLSLEGLRSFGPWNGNFFCALLVPIYAHRFTGRLRRCENLSLPPPPL
jgi:hypothetical protein